MDYISQLSGKHSKKAVTICLFSAILTFCILLLLFFIKGYAPFGNKSLVTMDCDLQYLDFFAYLKDILSSSNSIFYSFSKVLGGTTIGLFSYYLASPFNILVLFFPKSELVSFVDITVALKLVAAAATCTLFLYYRFRESHEEGINNNLIICFLSVSYALGQYSIAQASNIMWLDGVYMLPMILLGISKLMREKRGTVLSIAVALSILFNWYTGGINCFFAILWFIFELISYIAERCGSDSIVLVLRKSIAYIFLFGLSMAIGVLISCILFLPTVAAMHKSAEGSLEINRLFDFRFLGNPLSLFDNYIPSAKSTQSSVSLYSGSLVILGCLSFFLSKDIKAGKKLPYLVLIIVTILSMYWNPLYMVFSLFKYVGSYWCRFSYLGILTMVFISASFFLDNESKSISLPITASAILFLFILLYRTYSLDSPYHFTKTVLLCVPVLVITALLIVLGTTEQKQGKSGMSTQFILCLCLFSAAFVLETGNGVSLQMDNYHGDNTDSFRRYSKEKQAQINVLKECDPGIYRVFDISIRDDRDNGLAAAYNEAMAYNYWSVSGYTSSPDAITSVFLDRLGYRSGDADMNITNTSILASDALLGVKYVLSKDPINGLEPLDSGAAESGKKIYQNPFVLPMALTYDVKSGDRSSVHNNFDYIDYLYTLLYGEKTNLFVRLDYACTFRLNGTLFPIVSA